MDFDLIYQTYFEDVFLYLRGLSNSETIAEEITQETFMKALKALDRFDGSKDIKAWLFTIAKNTYFTYCKRQKLFLEIVIVDNIAAPQSDFTLRVEDEESAFCIHQFLHQMKEPYKEVFTLRVFGELPSLDKDTHAFRRRKSALTASSSLEIRKYSCDSLPCHHLIFPRRKVLRSFCAAEML